MKPMGITPILNVSSIQQSVDWFQRLGWSCPFAWNGKPLPPGVLADADGQASFASVCAGGAQIFLCRDGQGLRGGKPARTDGDDDMGATWMSIWLSSPTEVDQAHVKAQQANICILWPPTDEPWGVRECRLMHPDGHVFRISASLPDTSAT